MSIEKVIDLYQGMHFESELRSINRLADGVTEGVIVALGSYRGQSDCALALHAHVPVYAVDARILNVGDDMPFGDIDRSYWMRNVLDMGLSEKIRPVNLTTQEVARVWTRPIGLLFIDASHDYESVRDDLAAWLPFVAPGGIVCVHDSNLPGIIQAVTERDDLVEFERASLTVAYHKEPLYEPFTYNGLTMWVRKGPYSKDDRYVLGEVRSYDIGPGPVRTCIDVGAQIGAFTCWIKQMNPRAIIVAVEPEISCSLLLSKNIEALDGVRAVWGRVNYDGGDKLLYVDPVNAGSHRVIDSAPPGTPYIPAPSAVTLEAIMREQGWDSLSLLKVDCEGCETDVLLNCSDDFLHSVRRIVGEFHTNFGSPIEPIQARLEALGFTVTAETNPAAHATFCAINQNWIVSDDEPAIEYGTVIEKDATLPFGIGHGVSADRTPATKRKAPARKTAAKGRKR